MRSPRHNWKHNPIKENDMSEPKKAAKAAMKVDNSTISTGPTKHREEVYRPPVKTPVVDLDDPDDADDLPLFEKRSVAAEQPDEVDATKEDEVDNKRLNEYWSGKLNRHKGDGLGHDQFPPDGTPLLDLEGRPVTRAQVTKDEGNYAEPLFERTQTLMVTAPPSYRVSVYVTDLNSPGAEDVISVTLLGADPALLLMSVSALAGTTIGSVSD